jgi:transcriptional regulator with XRE-family HTH domain
MDERRLELKAEMVRRGMTQRDLARLLREQGFDMESYDVARIVAGRLDPSESIRSAIAVLLDRPSFEIFARGAAK